MTCPELITDGQVTKYLSYLPTDMTNGTQDRRVARRSWSGKSYTGAKAVFSHGEFKLISETIEIRILRLNMVLIWVITGVEKGSMDQAIIIC